MLNDPSTLFRLRAMVGRSFKRDGVPETPELHRVLDLPRRVWEERGDLEEFTLALTKYLRRPQGTQMLRPVQAVALQELHDCGGLLGPIPVGVGKTLVSFLAPVVLEVERPVLVVPAKLRDKTLREFAVLGEHWRRHPKLEVLSYEKLSREGGTKYMQKLQPDLLIFDEAHKLKNGSAAVTRKVKNWMKACPQTRVIAMSGTITKRSLLDFAHILRWALPLSCPLPQSASELEAWAAAVDEIKNFEQRVQTSPGALTAFCSPLEKQQGLAGVRSGLRRRIQETPGVVACGGASVEASLNVSLYLVDEYGDEIKRLAARLHEGVLPNGDVYVVEGKEHSTQALQARWRIMRTLTSGFWYRWEPQPPKDWLELRSKWKKIVRGVLEEHVTGLESEALVTRAAMQNRLGLGAHETYEEWSQVKDKHKWAVVPVWEDDCVIERVRQWARKHSGLIWVSEVALGRRLEEELGLPYFHEMGRDSVGRTVEMMIPSDGCIVLSVASNSEGRNLQAWNDNLVISPPPTGNTWEQVIGRSHRQGQEADEVSVDVLIGCEVEWQCWQQAMKDARYASSIEGPKKLTYATIDQTFRVPPSDGLLW